jgi:predicted transcriptional regulator
MRAGDLAAPVPTVGTDTPVIDAARLLAAHNLPGLIVVDRENRPLTVLPGTQVLRMAVPRYCQEDPALARVVDEATADLFVGEFIGELAGRTVAESLPERRQEIAVVDPDATLLEIAALMARARSPIVAVAGDDRRMIGAITLEALLDRILAS